jgi:hypothetical protein
MRLTRPQERLLTTLALDSSPCFDHALRVYADGERIAGDQWPTLLTLFELELVTFGVLYALRPHGEITITDDGLDVLAALN